MYILVLKHKSTAECIDLNVLMPVTITKCALVYIYEPFFTSVLTRMLFQYSASLINHYIVKERRGGSVNNMLTKAFI